MINMANVSFIVACAVACKKYYDAMIAVTYNCEQFFLINTIFLVILTVYVI